MKKHDVIRIGYPAVPAVRHVDAVGRITSQTATMPMPLPRVHKFSL